MKLTSDKVAQIKASHGVYAAADVARHFDVHRSNVLRIWNGRFHRAVPAAEEPPNIETRSKPGLREDVAILLNRGHSPQEVAEILGISKGYVYALGKGVFV